MTDQQHMSVRAVAALRGCSDRTVRMAIERGDLDAIAIVNEHGRTVAYAVARQDGKRWSGPRPAGRPRKTGARRLMGDT